MQNIQDMTDDCNDLKDTKDISDVSTSYTPRVDNHKQKGMMNRIQLSSKSLKKSCQT